MQQERDRISQAIAALEGVSENHTRGPSGPRRISPAARARIIAAQKARWAAWRKKRRSS